jgi:hypothetical protein
MCKKARILLAVFVLTIAAYALIDGRHTGLVAIKTVEGLGGGVLFGLTAAADRWIKLHRRTGFSLWRFRCIVLREVKVGLCAGLLVGVFVVILSLLTS